MRRWYARPIPYPAGSSLRLYGPHSALRRILVAENAPGHAVAVFHPLGVRALEIEHVHADDSGLPTAPIDGERALAGIG